MDSELTGLLGSLLIAIVAAYLGSTLTLHRVKREKRWDSRHEAYKSILRGLHDIRFWADETYAETRMLPSVGAAKKSELQKRFDDAKHELWAQVHIGQLSVSAETRSLLAEVLGDIAAEEHRFDEDRRGEEDYLDDLADHCEKMRHVVDRRLTALLAAAESDLS